VAVTNENKPHEEGPPDNRPSSGVRRVWGKLTQVQKGLIAFIITIGTLATAVTATLDLGSRLTSGNQEKDNKPPPSTPIAGSVRYWCGGEVSSVEGGVCVVEVIPGSPADRAEIKVGDIITDMGGNSVKDVDEFTKILKQTRTGDTILISIVRGDSHRRYVRVKPENIEGSKLRLGVTVEDLEPQTKKGNPGIPPGPLDFLERLF
jgi:S1-C subfamily serine protease